MNSSSSSLPPATSMQNGESLYSTIDRGKSNVDQNSTNSATSSHIYTTAGSVRSFDEEKSKGASQQPKDHGMIKTTNKAPSQENTSGNCPKEFFSPEPASPSSITSVTNPIRNTRRLSLSVQNGSGPKLNVPQNRTPDDFADSMDLNSIALTDPVKGRIITTDSPKPSPPPSPSPYNYMGNQTGRFTRLGDNDRTGESPHLSPQLSYIEHDNPFSEAYDHDNDNNFQGLYPETYTDDIIEHSDVIAPPSISTSYYDKKLNKKNQRFMVTDTVDVDYNKNVDIGSFRNSSTRSGSNLAMEDTGSNCKLKTIDTNARHRFSEDKKRKCYKALYISIFTFFFVSFFVAVIGIGILNNYLTDFYNRQQNFNEFRYLTEFATHQGFLQMPWFSVFFSVLVFSMFATIHWRGLRKYYQTSKLFVTLAIVFDMIAINSFYLMAAQLRLELKNEPGVSASDVSFYSSLQTSIYGLMGMMIVFFGLLLFFSAERRERQVAESFRMEARAHA